ncbi:hypothetical protein L211DRAFT_415068 [Terfezia boudieri ATCC MYA-4762]|uniref:Uncharacterized protein n=1 Tax=Terfezia boudieri ATCC MYA-4762 TaxID=1051890 RepID=A0A3N4LJY2_9PEZI|nr:hypothetical protein L211DRAFT_415068 [Terfezia boudieri ATCC MYA-4762]
MVFHRPSSKTGPAESYQSFWGVLLFYIFIALCRRLLFPATVWFSSKGRLSTGHASIHIHTPYIQYIYIIYIPRSYMLLYHITLMQLIRTLKPTPCVQRGICINLGKVLHCHGKVGCSVSGDTFVNLRAHIPLAWAARIKPALQPEPPVREIKKGTIKRYKGKKVKRYTLDGEL